MQTTPTAALPSRLAGAIWLLYFLAALPLAVRSAMLVPADAAATARHILSAEGLYRATVVADLISYALYMVFAGLLYVLLRHVSRRWAAVGTLFTLAGCFVLAAATATVMVPLLLLDGGGASAIGLAARQELALLALRAFGQAYAVALFFFGAQWVVVGPLFAKSRLVPRAIGWLLAAAGIAWLVLSTAMLAAPPLAALLRGVVMPFGGLAELALALWLLIKRPVGAAAAAV